MGLRIIPKTVWSSPYGKYEGTQVLRRIPACLTPPLFYTQNSTSLQGSLPVYALQQLHLLFPSIFLPLLNVNYCKDWLCRLRFFCRCVRFSSRGPRNKSALGVGTGYNLSLSYCLPFLQGSTFDFHENPSCFWKGACSQKASPPFPSSAAFSVQPEEESPCHSALP